MDGIGGVALALQSRVKHCSRYVLQSRIEQYSRYVDLAAHHVHAHTRTLAHTLECVFFGASVCFFGALFTRCTHLNYCTKPLSASTLLSPIYILFLE